MRIRIQLFTLMRIRSQLLKIMRIQAYPDQQPSTPDYGNVAHLTCFLCTEICEELCRDLSRDMKAKGIVGQALTVKIKSHDFKIRQFSTICPIVALIFMDLFNSLSFALTLVRLLS